MAAAFIALAALVLAAVAVVALRSRRPRAAVLSTAPPRPHELAMLGKALLGREPEPGELADGLTLAEAAAAITAGAAHREAVAAGQAGVLAGSALAEELLPPGTPSPDGAAVVGTEGRLYIAHGANDFIRQYRGETPLSPEGVASWSALLDRTRAEADALGVPFVPLVIPDKLAIDPAGYPEPLAAGLRRPIHQLLEARPGALVYPLDELQRAHRRTPVSLRTDSHINSAGAQVVHDVVVARLGLARAGRRPPRPERSYVMAGDLGVKFTPKVHELAQAPEAGPGIELVEDNARTILDLGGHLGVRRVTRNERAPVDGRLVVFGDSYSYIEPAVAGNLGEFLARTFREVHFLWAPFCWDAGYLSRHPPDAVVLQMAERFAITVPREGADVEALAVETLRRKGGIVPEEITDPAVTT